MSLDAKISKKAQKWWVEGYSQVQVLEKATAFNDAMNGNSISPESLQAIVEYTVSYPPSYWTQQSSDSKVKRENKKSYTHRDPGKLTKKIMNMPGFVNTLKQYTIDTSVYPNEPMAFGASLSYHAFQVSRKVTDPFGTTANTYIMGLSPSGSGKDRGRKVNTELASLVIRELDGKNISSQMGDQFASAEGIEDAMMHQKVMLYQNDEFDRFLTNTNKGIDIRYNNLTGLLLRMYSEAKGTYTMRRLAKDTETKVIHKPYLILFATAVERYFYDSVNEQMLDNGFYSRLWTILGNAERVYNEEYTNRPIDEGIIEIATEWANYGGKDFHNLNPELFVIEHDQDAWDMLMDIRKEVDARYNEAIKCGNGMEASVWARVFEGINKFAMLACTSRNNKNLQINTGDIELGHAFLMQQTNQGLYMADQHVHAGVMDKAVKKVEQLLISHDNTMSRSNLMRGLGHLKKDAKHFTEILNTMKDMNLIEFEDVKTKTKPAMYVNYIGGE